MAAADDLEQKRRLAVLSETFMQFAAKQPSLKQAFNRFASPAQKKAIEACTDNAINARADLKSENAERRQAAQNKMYDNVILRAETYAAVLSGVDTGTMAALVRMFAAAQENEALKGEDFTKILDDLHAPTLARAAKRAAQLNKP